MYSAGTVRLRLTISISGAGGGREEVQGGALNSHHCQVGRVAARFEAWLAGWWVGGLVGCGGGPALPGCHTDGSR